MPREKHDLGVRFYAPNRKRPIIYTTKAVSDFLAIIHERNPTYNINQLKELITDRTKFIRNPDAIEVLDTYIKLGYGDEVPRWR